MGCSTGFSFLLLLMLQCADAQQVPPLHPESLGPRPHGPNANEGLIRALVGAECWYPNYYCSVTANNTQTPVVVTGGAEACYDKCKSDSSCNFFTWFERRGVEYCYLLTECGKDYQISDDWCLQRSSCVSGPSDCTAAENNTMCPILDTTSGDMEWQCENGGTGLNINGYNGTIETGARCMLSCASWKSRRWANKSAAKYTVLDKGFVFSTCQADGTWTDVLPNDFEDDVSVLDWPRPSNLELSTYPKPNEGSLPCGCSDLVLVWPPLSRSQAGHKWYYNPRDEEGATMECEDEVQNSLVVSTKEFRIKSNNTCRFLCDDYLVSTVKCVDGKWTGDKDQGFWCYNIPEIVNRLQSYLPRMTPTNGSMSSQKGNKAVENCIFNDDNKVCVTKNNKDPYPWIAVDMGCPNGIGRIEFKNLADVTNIIDLKVIVTKTVPTTAASPFEDGEEVKYFPGLPTSNEKYEVDVDEHVDGCIVVFQTNITSIVASGTGSIAAKKIKIFGVPAVEYAQREGIST